MVQGRIERTCGVILLAAIVATAGATRADALDEGGTLAVTNYDLDLSFDFEASRLFADCTVTLVNGGSDSVANVPLYLFRTLAVSSVSDSRGNALGFTQRVASLADWPQRQVNMIDVALSEALDPGDALALRLRYDGFLLGYAELGMLYVRDHVDREFTIVRQDCDAYPQLRGASWSAIHRMVVRQRFDYRIRVEVPSDLIAANGGELVEQRKEDGAITFVYRNSKPAWRIDVAVADYSVLEGGPSKVFAFRKHEAGGRKVLEALDRTLALYSEYFGPLRDFRGFAVIEIPDGWGSQADVTSILQTSAAFEDAKQLPQLFHEVAHQWNVPPLDPAPCRVESEGLATFLQFVAEEKLTGKTGTVRAGVEGLSDQVRRALERDPSSAAVPLIRLGEKSMTDLAYTKGGVFFAVMYELVGQDIFNRIIRRHYEQFASRGATTQQFVETCRALVGTRLDRLFQEWLFGTSSSSLFQSKASLEQMVARYR